MKQLTELEIPLDLLTSPDTIVIDVRPYALYLRARLANSLNMCVPTTLLKRKAFALRSIVGSMQKSQQDYINWKLDRNEKLNFILYDDLSSSSNASFHLYETCLKVVNYIDSIKDKQCSVSILQGGISKISSESPILDHSDIPVLSPMSTSFSESSKNSSSPLSISNSISASPQSLSHSIGSLSGFSLPIDCDFSHKFAASIKKNAIVQGSRDSKILHLPSDSVLSEDNVPPWLRFCLDTSLASDLIDKKFTKLEDIESMRLESVARLNVKGSEKHSSHCCSSDACSPSSPCLECDQICYTLPEGIEYGEKNRYSNIWPYEHSRVKNLYSPLISNTVLSVEQNWKRQDDYFNANYVTVPRISRNKYIATQAPLPSTFDDFWRAVWYNKVEIIICLTNLAEGAMKKSDNYWQDCLYESGIDVKLLSEVVEKESGIVIRTLQLQKTSSRTNTTTKKLIKQIEYRDWPDFGVPPTPESVMNLVKVKNSFINDKYAPIAVHCSAGCGRTGTFITIDVMLQMLRKSLPSTTPLSAGTPLVHSLNSPFLELDRQLLPKTSDKLQNSPESLLPFEFWGEDDLIYKTVNVLRRQRLSMVQTLSQYLMCYEVVLLAVNSTLQDL